VSVTASKFGAIADADPDPAAASFQVTSAFLLHIGPPLL
jgi:hypothetical protein